ncbi:hypothetical protein EVAR_44013_1 [Eumeta japonica]|uniref:Uncharacterized protein n=1 Tax=Eumeta variegata TaxID=151549 RepID=A0A4C1XEZ5_EUMVA|nr:hypothetical protein EVAR_44013_1 [Eumeta japonica]
MHISIILKRCIVTFQLPNLGGVRITTHGRPRRRAERMCACSCCLRKGGPQSRTVDRIKTTSPQLSASGRGFSSENEPKKAAVKFTRTDSGAALHNCFPHSLLNIWAGGHERPAAAVVNGARHGGRLGSRSERVGRVPSKLEFGWPIPPSTIHFSFNDPLFITPYLLIFFYLSILLLPNKQATHWLLHLSCISASTRRDILRNRSVCAGTHTSDVSSQVSRCSRCDRLVAVVFTIAN